ncbi:hypothetical protein LXA43DRAFT_1101173 [Ganoderma leucocontextum]|nr:hypothetical protein LXA43DRAFT_1101173 [Ganoderma leucocontextum]
MSRWAKKRTQTAASTADPSLTADFEISLAEAFEAATPSLLMVDRVSADSRHLYQHAVSVPSPGSQSPAPPPTGLLPPSVVGQAQDWDPFFLPQAFDNVSGVGDSEGTASGEGNEKAPHYLTSDELMKQFIPKQQFFLDELLWHDGRGDFTVDKCASCPDPATAQPATIRCKACSPGPLLCDACAVQLHSRTPYHHIQRWTGAMFEDISLKAIGLKIQLGHQHDGSACSNPAFLREDFTRVATEVEDRLA